MAGPCSPWRGRPAECRLGRALMSCWAGFDPHPAPTPLNNTVSISETRLPFINRLMNTRNKKPLLMTNFMYKTKQVKKGIHQMIYYIFVMNIKLNVLVMIGRCNNLLQTKMNQLILIKIFLHLYFIIMIVIYI